MIVDIPDDWMPTAESINALPMPLRNYIHHLATTVDLAATVQENFELRRQVAAAETMYRETGR